MYGAIIGDIAGSVYEFDSIKTKDFPILGPGCTFTDDTVMTIAIASALVRWKRQGMDLPQACTVEMRHFGRHYPNAGYGGRFARWLRSPYPKPYKSYGNGSAMRVSPCGLLAHTEEEALTLARISAEVTHNHPEGIRGAEATALAIFLAKSGCSKEEMRARLRQYYPLERTLDEIRPDYRFDETCQGSVPEALESFLVSDSYEDTLRNAISLGGDADTLAAIAGSVAWAWYGRDGMQDDMRALLERITLPPLFLTVIQEFEKLVQAGE